MRRNYGTYLQGCHISPYLQAVVFTSTAYISEFENILAFTKPEIHGAKYCLKDNFPLGYLP